MINHSRALVARKLKNVKVTVHENKVRVYFYLMTINKGAYPSLLSPVLHNMAGILINYWSFFNKDENKVIHTSKTLLNAMNVNTIS